MARLNSEGRRWIWMAICCCHWWTVVSGLEVARACPDGSLSFQTSISDLSTLFRAKSEHRQLIRQNVTSPLECAHLCYTAGNSNCKSAIYTPRSYELLDRKRRAARDSMVEANVRITDLDERKEEANFGQREGGHCTLLALSPPCSKGVDDNSKIGGNSNIIERTTSIPVLIYCFSCRQENTEDERMRMSATPFEDGLLTVQSVTWRNRTADGGVISENESNDVVLEAKKKTSGQRMKRSRQISLRVMTFNTWLSGFMVDDGLDKLAKHIKLNDPDIVFLQELSDQHVASLIARLANGDRKWRACSRNWGNFDHILTHYKIVAEYEPVASFWNTGCQIQLDDQFIINLWNVHLYQHNYGPYKACFKSEQMQSINDLHRCEYDSDESRRSRLRDLMSLQRHEAFAQLLRQASENGPPLIVAGDFNAPSHLDWIDQAKVWHCDHAFEWPVSKLMEKMGFKDSYRQAHSDPYWYPGSTWSAIYKDSTTEQLVSTNGKFDAEPQDRIDYIYFKSDRLQVTDAWVYSGLGGISRYPNHKYNDWPSDHAAVVANYAWSL